MSRLGGTAAEALAAVTGRTREIEMVTLWQPTRLFVMSQAFMEGLGALFLSPDGALSAALSPAPLWSVRLSAIVSVRPRLQLFASRRRVWKQAEDELLALLGPASARRSCQAASSSVAMSGPHARGISGCAVLLRLFLRCGTVPARDFATLRRGLSVFAFPPTCRSGASIPLSVHVSSERCRLISHRRAG